MAESHILQISFPHLGQTAEIFLKINLLNIDHKKHIFINLVGALTYTTGAGITVGRKEVIAQPKPITIRRLPIDIPCTAAEEACYSVLTDRATQGPQIHFEQKVKIILLVMDYICRQFSFSEYRNMWSRYCLKAIIGDCMEAEVEINMAGSYTWLKGPSNESEQKMTKLHNFTQRIKIQQLNFAQKLFIIWRH